MNKRNHMGSGSIVSIIILTMAVTTSQANHPPVADAGPDRYIGEELHAYVPDENSERRCLSSAI